MKKAFLIFAISVTLLGIFVTASPFLLRISGLDESLKQYVLPKILDDTKGHLDVRNVTIGLGKLAISGVSVVDADERYKLLIESIEFHFYLHEMILHPSHPEKAVKAIYLIKPRFILNQSIDDSVMVARSEAPDSSNNLQNFLNTLSNVEGIDDIQIREGRIIWASKAGEFIALAHQVQGRMVSAGESGISLSGSGSILSTIGENFTLQSRINLKSKKISADLKIDNYEIKNSVLPYFTNEVRIDEGIVTADFRFENQGFIFDSSRVDGQLQASGLRLRSAESEFNDINFLVNVEKNALHLSDASALFHDHPAEFSARIDNVFQPEIVAALTSKKIPLKYLKPYVNNDAIDNMAVDLNTIVELLPAKQQIKAHISAPALYVDGSKQVEDISAKILVDKSRIECQGLSAIFQGIALKGRAHCNLENQKMNLNLAGLYRTGTHSILDRISDRKYDFSLNLNYNNKIKRTSGDWHFSISALQDTLFMMDGGLDGNSNELNINLEKSNAKNLNASFQLIDYLSDPQITRARLVDFPFHFFTSDAMLLKPLKRYSTDMSLTGTIKRLTGKIAVVDRLNTANDFYLNTTITDLFKKKKNVDGTIELKNLFGKFGFELGESYLKGNIDFPDGIEGDLNLDLQKDEQVAGNITFKDFNIVQAMSDSMLNEDFRLQGNIDGEVILRGTLDDPQISANLNGDKFVFNDVGYYQANLSLIANQDSVNIDSLTVSINNLPVIDGSIALDLDEKQVSGNFSGEMIDVEQIITTISSGSPLITGLVDYSLDIAGKLDQPQIMASVQLRDGVFFRTAFDDFSFIISDQLNSKAPLFDLASHNFVLRDISLSKNGRFNLTGGGKVPFDNQSEMSLLFNFKGDILSLIPDYQGFFTKGLSNSEIQLVLAGRPDRLRIESGFCEIERGELWMQKVAPHLENINGRIELEAGKNQVDFINFKATVDNEELTINTVRDVMTEDRGMLKPWYFSGMDLDFGVLQLGTTGKGIELNIPGLMTRNDIGHLHLSGRNEGEMFYFAGPVKHPVARGTAVLYDTRLTYPFLIEEIPGQKPSVVVEFLNNIDWDVLVRSGEDVVYFCEIPAYIDKVDTEVFIDETSPGLEFTGILKTGSFKPLGKMTSSRGRLEYLDQTFKVDRFAMEFNEWDLFPSVSGRAWTTIRDSVGAIPKTIYLQLYAIDEETGAVKQQGNWENFKFKLVSADPQIGESQEQVLAYLGFSVGNIRQKATSVGGAMTEKYLIRPLLRPIERALEKSLGVDFVRINSNIAKNLFYTSLGSFGQVDNAGTPLVNPFATNTPYLFLMQSSELTLGKYVSQNLYLTYTGQLVSIYDQNDTGFDVNHSFGIEYRFLRNVLVELEYDRELAGYYNIENQKQYLEDFKIRLRHSFSF